VVAFYRGGSALGYPGRKKESFFVITGINLFTFAQKPSIMVAGGGENV
jgi:hypothetical protein